MRFDRGRLPDALWERKRLFWIVAIGALFAGGLVGRFFVPRDYVAESVVQSVTFGAPALRARLYEDDLLRAAERLLPRRSSVRELRERIEARMLDDTRLALSVHGASDEAALSLTEALVAALVSDGAVRSAAQHAQQLSRHARELSEAHRALSEASATLSAALTAHGIIDLEGERRALSARVHELEAELSYARALISGSDESAREVSSSVNKVTAQRASVELVEAQRALSASLASGAGERELTALRTRIARLQHQTIEPRRAGSAQAAEARVQRGRATQFERELNRVHAELARLDEVQRANAREMGQFTHAKERLSAIQDREPPAPEKATVRILSRAHIARVDGRMTQILSMIATPILALLMLTASIWLAEIRDFRVAVASEVAEWLGMPVLASSVWPSDPPRLEGLIDELAEGALEARGTTLVFPVSELERPLALTIAARLNARAQRHFRTLTGARVTVAQGWQGELSGPSARRAAENADRVLWIVTADSHRGNDLSRRRADLPRSDGCAAVLLDARHPRAARSIGDLAPFWAAEATGEQAARFVPPARVPLH